MANSSAKTNSTHRTTVIVPCAGYGTRVGSPPAKELLINPNTQAPLIDHCLQVADQHQWNKVLITRSEKKNLMDYVTKWETESPLKSQWVLVPKTTEWPESILKSADFWSEKNILILPDTTWTPVGIEKKVVQLLDHCDIAYGVFETLHKKTWGTVALSENSLKLCEKPENVSTDFQAWGLIAFKKNIGKILFETLLESTMDHQVKTLQIRAQKISMDSFVDLTRV